MKKSESYLSKLDACLTKKNRYKRSNKHPYKIVAQTEVSILPDDFEMPSPIESTYTVEGKTFNTLKEAKRYLQKEQKINDLAEWLDENGYEDEAELFFNYKDELG